MPSLSSIREKESSREKSQASNFELTVSRKGEWEMLAMPRRIKRAVGNGVVMN
jgi:hypothetical protein